MPRNKTRGSSVIDVDGPTHVHTNWAFTEPGVYVFDVTYSAEGVGGAEYASAPAELVFSVGEGAGCEVPEPAKPSEPTEPAEPTEPSEPAEPTEPTEPTEPGKAHSSQENLWGFLASLFTLGLFGGLLGVLFNLPQVQALTGGLFSNRF